MPPAHKLGGPLRGRSPAQRPKAASDFEGPKPDLGVDERVVLQFPESGVLFRGQSDKYRRTQTHSIPHGDLAQAYLKMKEQERTIEDHRTLQERTFYGQEKKPIPALLGLMNMVLHGVAAPRIYRRNTLEENIRQVRERFNVIMTNPPFGGIEGRHIRANFPIPASATELLFLQHIMRKLNPRDGARCGMVVAEGTLFRGGSFAEVKKALLQEFHL